MSRRLLQYLLSYCHKCGNIEEFSIKSRKKELNYILEFTCPKCSHHNEIIVSLEDIQDYLRNNNS